MVKNLSIFWLLLFAPLIVMADQPRSRDVFTSANKKFEARLKDGQWQMFEKKSARRVLYTFANKQAEHVWLSSMTLLISDDGSNVVAVDDYSRQFPNLSPEVILFFRNGERTKSYTLDEVIDERFISYSVSHFSWCFLPNKIVIDNEQLNITTNEFKNLIFDVKTGALVSKEDDKRIPDGSIFISGKVNHLGKQLYEIAVDCTVRGNVKPGSRVTFTADKSVWINSNFYNALVITEGKAVANYSVVFNNCAQRTVH